MYQILLAPFLSALAAQLLKIFIRSNGLRFNWRDLTSYSGMPSSHAATAVSLAFSAGLKAGFSSPVFAVSAVLCFFIIRDALGLRQYVGRHGQTLNLLVKDLRANTTALKESYPLLPEKVGHTPAQIIAGGFLGLAISLLCYRLI